MQSITSIQALRGFAALAVVIVHMTVLFATRMPGTGIEEFRAATSGVDLFFAISGFVMMMSLQGKDAGPSSAFAFLRARLVRILPLYWIFTTIRLSANFIMPDAMQRGGWDWAWIAQSLLFIPAYAPDGSISPPLSVGWTLSFEMFFYLTLTVGIALRLHYVAFASAAMLIMTILGFVLPPPGPAVQYLANAMCAEFLLGMLVFRLYSHGVTIGPRIAAAVIIMSFACILATGHFLTFEQIGSWRLFLLGIPSALILYSLVSVEGRIRFARLFLILGDASYSLYLSHILTLRVIFILMNKAFGDGSAMGTPMLITIAACSIAASIAVGLASYYFIEAPLLRKLKPRKKLDPPAVSVNASFKVPS